MSAHDPPQPPQPPQQARRLVVFTDLDGTLLNHDDYDFRPALPAIERLQAAAVPLVIVSSKTRPEIERLQAQLGIADPFAPENGAAIVWPASGLRFSGEGRSDAEVVRFGPSYADLRQALARARASAGLSAQGFGDVDAVTVAAWTGLSEADAALAKQRIGTEPVWVGQDPAARATLGAALRAAGIMTTEGGRFVHAIGPFDKGKALTAIAARYQRAWPQAELVTAALGDSPNDRPMLEAADHPVIVPRAHGVPLTVAHDGAWTASAAGARGFAQGIEHILRAVFDDRATATKGDDMAQH